jgi:hypothetical protein
MGQVGTLQPLRAGRPQQITLFNHLNRCSAKALGGQPRSIKGEPYWRYACTVRGCARAVCIPSRAPVSQGVPTGCGEQLMWGEVILTAAGASCGLRRALLPGLGAAAVCGVQLVAVGSGLGILLSRWPQVQIALPCVSAGCLLYLGAQLLRRRGAGPGAAGELITFWESAARQFLNPRTWLMSLAAATLLPPLQLQQVLAHGYSGTI